MCGICGFKGHFSEGRAAELIRTMSDSISHRGNDASGFFVEAPIALGHQRLSILDLDHRSDQPMISADGRYVIVFNGEIYNFHELRSGLADFLPVTTSDTEILLELWAREGPACLNRLNGMYAFSVYDRRKKVLFCVRDRLGVKPFYYWHYAGAFAFASEAKALLRHPSVASNPDLMALSDYLSLGYVTGTSTIYAAVQKLEPGHYLVVGENGMQNFCYWSLSDKIASGEPADAGEIIDLLGSAVDYRLISDVPVGSFLSGGIDSAAVTALAAKKCPNLQTFTIGFCEKAYDESGAAANFAEGLKLSNQVDFFCEPDITFLQKLVKYFDQPFADTSALPFYQLCNNASSSIRTVLCGDGGDELFAGYETRRADLFALMGFRSIPFWGSLLKAGSSFMKLIPADRGKVSTHYKLRQFFEFAHLPPQESHFSWRLLFTEAEKQELLSRDVCNELANYQTWQKFSTLFDGVSDLPVLQQQAVVDMQTWLVDDILYKADQASMACTLEVRAPFLDYRLVEAAFTIPEKHKFDLFRGKTMLRKKLSGLLPREVLKRKKEGFGSPVSVWLEGPLAGVFADCIHDAAFREFFPDTTKIMGLYDDHRNRVKDNGYRLWALFMFALWQKEWLKC
ncbi:MAG: asparagine synthase (glutamine-hydrolyzing) [Candidatus Riflebacteria bacterium]|nr:asparagine synthase (glutamine-hydrolyzing) [Candidatus Riflebacteria bacterium]